MDVVGALAALAGRFPDARASALVGLGLHRPMTEAELAPWRAACPWPVLNHDPDACVALGEVQGLPASAHPALLEADEVIAVGKVELHQYAGFSGGHKAVAVGLGGRETLAALHARERVCHPDVVVGRLEGNPFREAVDALGRLVGVGWAMQQLPDGRWVGGPPEQALATAARALDPWEPVYTRAATCLLRVPPAKAANFYQASRAATYLALSPAPPLEPGALLVLDAACPEGVGLGSGERAFAELMRAHAGRLGALLSGPVPRGGGLQRAFMLARLFEGHRLVVAGCEQPDALRAIGVDATNEPAARVAGPAAMVVERPFERLPQLLPPGLRAR